ncbi:hypothetical protein, partial [Paracoccus jiaweipingae]|uniref:hypothetical protein n=1 Tax=Paracoccus sp. p2-l61 TaxID=3366950 RepID=UPI0037A2068F
MSGIATPNLPQQPVVDELIGNADGNTVRISLDRLIALVMGGHGPSYETRAGLVADLDWAEGTIATVWGGDEATRGVYRKRGATGSGSWARMGDLPGMSTTLAALAAKADKATVDNRGTRAMGSRAEAAARVGDLPETVTRIWHSEAGEIVFRGRGVMGPDALNSDGWGVIAELDPTAVSGKAEKSALEALSTAVSEKANKAALEALSAAVSE